MVIPAHNPELLALAPNTPKGIGRVLYSEGDVRSIVRDSLFRPLFALAARTHQKVTFTTVQTLYNIETKSQHLLKYWSRESDLNRRLYCFADSSLGPLGHLYIKLVPFFVILTEANRSPSDQLQHTLAES